MGLFNNNRIEVNHEMVTGQKYRITNYQLFNVNGKFGMHVSCICQDDKGNAFYLPQSGANSVRDNQMELEEVLRIDGAVYVEKKTVVSKRYNKNVDVVEFSPVNP